MAEWTAGGRIIIKEMSIFLILILITALVFICNKLSLMENRWGFFLATVGWAIGVYGFFNLLKLVFPS